MGGPQWAMANPGNVVGLPPAAPLLRPPLTLVRLPQLFHHRRLRRIRVSPDRRTVVAAVGRMARGGSPPSPPPNRVLTACPPPRRQVCVLSAFDMDHVRADLGQRDLEALLSAQVQQSDAATVARSQCSSPSARDDGRGEPGREGLSACAADSSAAGPSSPSSLPPPSAVPTKARMRQHNRLSDATARQAAFLGLARDLDSECEAWLAQTQAQPGAGAATHPQVLASGAVANAEASDTGDHTAGAAMEGAGVWAGPDLWGGSSASSASSRDSTEPEASWTGPEPGTRREGAAAVAAARRFGGMYWLYASAATARVPSVSGDSGAAVAGDGGASVTATAGSADHSDVASLGWESLRAEEPHWVPGVSACLWVDALTACLTSPPALFQASLLNRNRLEILQEPLQGYTFSLSVRDRRHGADCRLTVPPPQFDASGRYMVTRRVLDDAEDGTEREATCVFDMQAPSLLPAIDPEGAPRGAVNGRDYSMDPDCVYPDRLVGLASDSAAASDLIKGPALSPCGRAVVSPYYNGLRVFSVEQCVCTVAGLGAPPDPLLPLVPGRSRAPPRTPPSHTWSSGGARHEASPLPASLSSPTASTRTRSRSSPAASTPGCPS